MAKQKSRRRFATTSEDLDVSQNRQKKPSLSIRRKLFFAFLALLYFAVVFECGVRLLVPQYSIYPRYLYIGDPHTGYRLRPDFSGRLQHTDFDVGITINSLGFRDSETENTEKKFRLVGLGDSATMGWGVEAEDTFWSLVEEQVPNVETVNMGVSGMGTIHQRALYVNYGRQLNPDLVVLLFNVNDVDDNMQGLSRTVRSGYLIPAKTGSPLFQVSLNSLADNSAAFHLIAYRLRKVSAIHRILRDSERERIISTGSTSKKIARTQRLIEQLHSSVVESGARFAVVFTHDHWFEAFAPWLSSLGVPVFSLASHLAEAKDISFPNDPHWNARGHAVVARLVSDFLLQEQLVPRQSMTME